MTNHTSRGIPTGELAILLLTSLVVLFSRSATGLALLLLPLLWSIRRWRHGHWIPRTPVDWPILGIMGMSLVSLFVTSDPGSSLDKGGGLVFSIALFYALVDWGQRQQSALPVAVLAAVRGGYGCAQPAGY